MSKKTKKATKRTKAQRIRQEANNIGRDLAIGILVLCFLALFFSCSRSSTVTSPDFYAMPLEPAGPRVQIHKAKNECTRHGDMTHKGTKICFYCEKPVRDEN
ncbi:hypothetical protein [Phaeodactylibacter xiamenensis]|uniref:hypothetical protein n=1 Tax=Phaeodactylibacter xiamenensis TaxID=1524460 RepID=UPI0024A7EB26|nr:hypothetical protein [Phaeodactylibacter xiamenensis]